MNLVNGNLWGEVGKAGLILFTANNTIRNGKLVMGKGAALEARKLFPGLDAELGYLIPISSDRSGWYGVVESGKYYADGTIVGAFQVKLDWNLPASLELILRSTAELLAMLPDYDRVAMNFPGIGAGGLAEQDVLPIISVLPENVFVYKR